MKRFPRGDKARGDQGSTTSEGRPTRSMAAIQSIPLPVVPAGGEDGTVAERRGWLLSQGWFISDCVSWCWRCNELIKPGQAIWYEVDAQAGWVRGECCAPKTGTSGEARTRM